MTNNVVNFNGTNNNEEEKIPVLQLNSKVYEQEPVYFYCKNCREIEALTNISLIASCIISDTTTEEEMDAIAKRLGISIADVQVTLLCEKCGNIMCNAHPIEASVMKGLEDKGYIVDLIGFNTHNDVDMLFEFTLDDSITIPSVPNIEYWDYEEARRKFTINLNHRYDFGLVAGADEFLKKCISELFIWINCLPDFK